MNYQARENDRYLPLPITQAANRIAWQFSQQQPTSQKAEQVRLNTLAVCAVRDYLEMMGVPVNWNECDSWNPFMRACVDAADLEVLGLGRLECRAIDVECPAVRTSLDGTGEAEIVIVSPGWIAPWRGSSRAGEMDSGPLPGLRILNSDGIARLNL